MKAILPLALPIYLLGDLITWVVLVVQDWEKVSGWRFFVSAFVLDVVLAQMWPIYWLILRPLFGR